MKQPPKPNLKRQAHREFCGSNTPRKGKHTDEPTRTDIALSTSFARAYDAWLERRGYNAGKLGKFV